VVPFPAGAKTLELLVDGQMVDRFETPAAGAQPQATLSVKMPAGADVAESRAQVGTIELDWGAAGLAPEGLSYDVQVSTNAGQSWQTLAIGLKQPSATVDLSGYEGKVQLRVIANSGFSSNVIDTRTVDIGPP
jgi:hypothetical protein